MVNERVNALYQAINNRSPYANIKLMHYGKAIEQNPEAPGFWEKWQTLMEDFGCGKGDFIVSSEPYGQKLAELTGAQFFPYDLDRQLNPAKGTNVRNDPLNHFADILPEFRRYMATRITIFGAESTGKTTLATQLASVYDAHHLFEYARPYLEQVGSDITRQSMTNIWRGQRALQAQVRYLAPKPIIIQDTDLFSTVGYWNIPYWTDNLGTCPQDLVQDAKAMKSDLYIVCKSNIPFEEDPLRYGGDHRETNDLHWTELLDQYDLPYIILQSSDANERFWNAVKAINHVIDTKINKLAYDRKGL